MSDRNFEELLQSPYSGREPDDDVPWKLPVGAAILGALVMAAYVIFATVTGPTESTEETTATSPAVPIEATGFAAGYMAVSDEVGMRAEVVMANGDETIVFVSSVVQAGADPSMVAPMEIATWSVLLPADEQAMLQQLAAKGSPGGVTVELSPLLDMSGASLVATLPGAVESTEVRLELPPDVPATVALHRISVGDSVVVIDELTVGNGFGYMDWHLEGGIGAKVDVVVEFSGTAFPLRLVTPYSSAPTFGVGTRPLPPLWGSEGATRLVREGEPLSAANVPEAITITFTVDVVTEAGETIDIPIVSPSS